MGEGLKYRQLYCWLNEQLGEEPETLRVSWLWWLSVRWGDWTKVRQSQGLQPLAVSLVGVDQAPPLWTHLEGCDFVRGSKITAEPQVARERKLSEVQVLLLKRLWTPVAFPNHNNNNTPWPANCQSVKVFCGQQASLQLPAKQIAPLLDALQQKVGIDPNQAELEINKILASHNDPRYYDWKLVILANTAGNSILLTQGP